MMVNNDLLCARAPVIAIVGFSTETYVDNTSRSGQTCKSTRSLVLVCGTKNAITLNYQNSGATAKLHAHIIANTSCAHLFLKCLAKTHETSTRILHQQVCKQTCFSFLGVWLKEQGHIWILPYTTVRLFKPSLRPSRANAIRFCTSVSPLDKYC